MRRRSMLAAFGLAALALFLLACGLLVAVKRTPSFYEAAACPADWDTLHRASRLLTRVQDLKNDIRSKAEWGDTFATEDLNCFFHENMSRKECMFCKMLPGGFHSPRVSIEGDRLRVGVRYREGFWSTVVWVEVKVWLVPGEINVVAVELCDLRAGGISTGSQSILDGIGEAVRSWNVDVQWYRNKSHPVGLFKFYADQPRPSAQILAFDVKDGKLAVAGRSFLDPVPTAGVPASADLPAE